MRNANSVEKQDKDCDNPWWSFSRRMKPHKVISSPSERNLYHGNKSLDPLTIEQNPTVPLSWLRENWIWREPNVKLIIDPFTHLVKGLKPLVDVRFVL